MPRTTSSERSLSREQAAEAEGQLGAAGAVVVFVVIDFLLIIIPFGFLELRPEVTKALLKQAQDWLMGHALRLMAAVALLLGAYLTVSGLVRLS